MSDSSETFEYTPGDEDLTISDFTNGEDLIDLTKL